MEPSSQLNSTLSDFISWAYDNSTDLNYINVLPEYMISIKNIWDMSSIALLTWFLAAQND
jgi:hypothetical protein